MSAAVRLATTGTAGAAVCWEGAGTGAVLLSHAFVDSSSHGLILTSCRSLVEAVSREVWVSRSEEWQCKMGRSSRGKVHAMTNSYT